MIKKGKVFCDNCGKQLHKNAPGFTGDMFYEIDGKRVDYCGKCDIDVNGGDEGLG